MAPNLVLVLLTCWVSCSSAIPFRPVVGSDYVAALSGIPLLGTYWNQLRSQRGPQADILVFNDDAESPGWYDPRTNGGQMLDFTTKRLGEPLNVIISGRSDPFILTDEGLHFYAKSLGFSEECLGLHYGHLHEADLGDGDNRKTELYLARQHYFPIWGTCWESLAGGHHFRAWKQNGTLANSRAWFIGASKELDSSQRHRIVPNGYNLGMNL